MKKISNDDIKKIQIDILDDVAGFCEKNSINYFLAYGTMLGAVRHKGYIPWEDDIDIAMLRSDYTRFCRLYKSEKSYYALSTYENDPNCYFQFGKVLDKRTRLIETDGGIRELSVYIDIFPIDNVPDERMAKKCLIKKQN